MLCRHPFEVSEARIVSCGRCSACLKSRSIELRNRTLWDVANSEDTPYFVTLTFREEVDPSSRYFQRFAKVVRKRGFRLRYVAVHDWGKMRGRYHLHAICMSDAVPRELRSCWPHGYSAVLRLTGSKAVGYCCGYNSQKLDMMQEWGLRILTSRRFGKVTRPDFMSKILRHALTNSVVPRYFFTRQPFPLSLTVPYSLRRVVADETGLPLEASFHG